MENTRNKIYINAEGFIEIILVGKQTGESFMEIYNNALPLIEQIQKGSKPIVGICDLSEETGFSLSSDKVAMEYLEKIPYQKLAMYGVPHLEVTKGIIMAMGKSHNTKIFETRAQALDWLHEK